jgi:hypothetical protein
VNQRTKRSIHWLAPRTRNRIEGWASSASHGKNSAEVREHLGNAHTHISTLVHKQADHVAGANLNLIYDALLEHYLPCLTPDYRHP